MVSHRSVTMGFIWLTALLISISIMLAIIKSDLEISKEKPTTKETLTWLAHEYKRINDSNEVLQRENDYLIRHSFHGVMNTLIAKCIEHDVPVSVALLVVQIESGFYPMAISSTNDHGLFQINYPIWKDELKIDVKMIYDPAYNIDLGLRILKYYHEKAGNWSLAVGMYNRGQNYALSGHPEKLAKSIFKGVIK